MVKRRDPGLVGGAVWWAFDIASLWACFSAFGPVPPVAILGAGLLPRLWATPCRSWAASAVDGGTIGALLALGADPGTTVVAVIVYRLISCWLPALPGALAYVQLRPVSRWEAADSGPAARRAGSARPRAPPRPARPRAPAAPRPRIGASTESQRATLNSCPA